ncbi:hypothetical protein S40285_05524 [Stachybotrys chlorohalonatus IBT 40285]|uniref:tRNA pseudouridine(55) synthase n=1 Tax=Stachybotrys chlorohalonatus (strain IBT 40285) TaxID=1283841 RepID=A0A084QBF4_STAC4|nr:hypothetical protein S40285_05524 [Stachybotrys chlorohalonata IBT 40285]
MASAIVRDGVFAINKPRGQSSAQVVRDCQTAFNPSAFFKPVIEAEKQRLLSESKSEFLRRKAQRRASQVKIGHGGTLDPLATGVLILGLGQGTKSLSQFLECTKSYETVILFGAGTDTYDRVGRVLSKRPYEHITREMVEKELENFKGKQMQIPPLYSALKMNGKPLYEYARAGKPIPREIEGRQVEVKDIELVEWYEPGKHNHRWPTEEADAAERNLAEQVWRAAKQQESSKKLTPEEKQQEDQAMAEHESFKRKFEERQDLLIRDSPNTSSKRSHSKETPMMSGALGQLPPPIISNKGANLIPAVDESTPPPWSDEGPPAVKIRMTVTTGFYVRSFCHDLGMRLGSAALMAELCRTRQSDFTVDGPNTLKYEDLAKGESVWGPQLADMLARWNGEPSGQWPGTDTPQSGAESPKKPPGGQREPKAKNPASPSQKGLGKRLDKRPRSPSPTGTSPSKKVVATESQKAARSRRTTTGSQRSDDEKSWNGIDD